jgi:DNA-binding protein YbaB
MSHYPERVEQAMNRYTKIREQTLEARHRMAAISSTVTAPRQVVSVTVGRHARVTAVKFPTDAYRRMAPAELAKVLMETIEAAQEKAMTEIAEIMAPMLPIGFDTQAMLRGDSSFEELLPADPAARDRWVNQE